MASGEITADESVGKRKVSESQKSRMRVKFIDTCDGEQSEVIRDSDETVATPKEGQARAGKILKRKNTPAYLLKADRQSGM